MEKLTKITNDLVSETYSLSAHFQTWWVLRSAAIPYYKEILSSQEYTDFFLISRSSHQKMIFITLSKIYDRNKNTSGISSLKEALNKNGKENFSIEINNKLQPHTNLITKLKNIRNQSISHNQTNLQDYEVFSENGITPEDIKELIKITVEIVDETQNLIKGFRHILTTDKYEKSLLNILEKLNKT